MLRFGIIAVLFSSSSYGQNEAPQEVPRLYRSVRTIAMGDAGAASAYGSESIFYNPALLSAVEEDREFIGLSPAIIASDELWDIYQNQDEFKELEKKPLDMAIRLRDRDINIRMQNSIGHTGDLQSWQFFQTARAVATLQTNPITFMPDLYAEVSAHAGLAHARTFHWTPNLHLGFGVRIMQKQSMVANIEGTELLDKQSRDEKIKPSELQDKRKGNGLGGDLGAVYRMESAWKPRFALVVQDVATTRYYGGEAPPPPDVQQVTLGYSIQPMEGAQSLLFALDIRDVLNETKSVVFKRLHMGGRWQYLEFIGLAGGLNQGYSSGGIFLKYRFAQLDWTMYGEEVGEQPGEKKSQRRGFRLTFGWLQ